MNGCHMPSNLVATAHITDVAPALVTQLLGVNTSCQRAAPMARPSMMCVPYAWRVYDRPAFSEKAASWHCTVRVAATPPSC